MDWRRSLVWCSWVCRSLPYHLRCLTVSTRLDISTPEGLANHAESVSCYLYEYGCNKTLWGKYYKSFFLYLLTASWQKLQSCFSSWHGLSFIQQLKLGITGDALMDHIRMIGDEFGPMALPEKLGTSDHTLAKFFSWNKNILCKIVHNTCKNLPVEVHTQLSQLTHLTSGSEDAIQDKHLMFNRFSKAAELAPKEKKALYLSFSLLEGHLEK